MGSAGAGAGAAGAAGAGASSFNLYFLASVKVFFLNQQLLLEFLQESYLRF
jgi:hypothetical protein